MSAGKDGQRGDYAHLPAALVVAVIHTVGAQAISLAEHISFTSQKPCDCLLHIVILNLKSLRKKEEGEREGEGVGSMGKRMGVVVVMMVFDIEAKVGCHLHGQIKIKSHVSDLLREFATSNDHRVQLTRRRFFVDHTNLEPKCVIQQPFLRAAAEQSGMEAMKRKLLTSMLTRSKALRI